MLASSIQSLKFADMAETRLIVHAYDRQISNSSVLKVRLKLLRSSADLPTAIWQRLG